MTSVWALRSPRCLCTTEDLERWEAEVAAYETGHPGYRADLEAKHRGRGGAGGSFKAAVARLGLRLPRKAEDLYYKAKTEVRGSCNFSWLHLDAAGGQ